MSAGAAAAANVVTAAAAVDPVEQAIRMGALLRKDGYFPVPIRNGDKRPYGDAWGERARAGEFFPCHEATGIGLLADGLRAVDIDIDDGDLVKEVLALAAVFLGEAPRRWRSNSPRCLLLYRAAEGEPRRKRCEGQDPSGVKAMVEILGLGHQFNTLGKHKSGVPIRWESYVPRDRLTAVTEQQIDDFLSAVQPLIGGNISKAAERQTSNIRQDLQAVDVKLLAGIVSKIPNGPEFDDRGTFVGFAHAVAAAFGADSERGRELFYSWCARWHQGQQREGEAERTWSTLGQDHEVGAEYLINKACAAGIDVSAYATAVAQSEFTATAPMPPELVEKQRRDAAVTWPPGYRMSAGGLYFDPVDKDKPPVWVTAPFDVEAMTRSSESDDWGMHLRWRDPDRRSHSWALPRELLHQEGGGIAAQLERRGLQCAPGKSAQSLLKLALAGVKVEARQSCVSRPGWHTTDTGSVFMVANGEVFGSSTNSIVLQAGTAITGDAFSTAGTLKEWQTEIAGYARGNSLISLFICAALAGPLLELVGEPSGGIHLVGKSQSGKSTAAFAAASVWGRGTRDAQVRSWRATANGLEGVAAECCDTVLILDELGQADGREVGDIVYGLANESGKARSTRSGEARRRKTWRVMVLSTGEVTLAAKMACAGQRAMAGQEVRMVTLPADAGAGLGVFEDLHGHTSAAALADHLRLAAQRTYGTAGAALVAKLTELRNRDSARLLGALAATRDNFLCDHVPTGADGQVRSVASRFALIAAAGEFARVVGVLPWAPGEATEAAAKCFHRFIEERGSAGAGEDAEAVKQVRAFLELHGESRFTRLEMDSITNRETTPTHYRTINRAGFARPATRDSEDVAEYLILPEAWKDEVCRGLDSKRAASILLSRGLLRGESSGRTTVREQLPGIGRSRVYAVSASILAGDPN